MKTFDDIRATSELIEAAGKAIGSDGSQDDTTLDLATIAAGALDGATDVPSPQAKRFGRRVEQLDGELKRRQPKTRGKTRHQASGSGNPW